MHTVTNTQTAASFCTRACAFAAGNFWSPVASSNFAIVDVAELINNHASICNQARLWTRRQANGWRNNQQPRYTELHFDMCFRCTTTALCYANWHFFSSSVICQLLLLSEKYATKPLIVVLFCSRQRMFLLSVNVFSAPFWGARCVSVINPADREYWPTQTNRPADA